MIYMTLCVVNDKSTKRNSEDTWLKVTKTTLQPPRHLLYPYSIIACHAFNAGTG
uniref:Uncharacterized protein n=1 Tax=Arundo donax TaxID=35708 RepID=A0A0A9AUT7_ARUDO